MAAWERTKAAALETAQAGFWSSLCPHEQARPHPGLSLVVCKVGTIAPAFLGACGIHVRDKARKHTEVLAPLSCCKSGVEAKTRGNQAPSPILPARFSPCFAPDSSL